MWDQLLAAREASRYELVRAPAASLLPELGPSGQAYLANNPSQHLKAHFSDEQVLLSTDDADYTDRASEDGGGKISGARRTCFVTKREIIPRSSSLPPNLDDASV